MHYVYILLCKDGTYYTGYTTDVVRRLQEHKEGIGSKYTRSHGAIRMVYTKAFDTRSEAMKYEYAIKQLRKITSSNLPRR
jgi:putative endonuclease